MPRDLEIWPDLTTFSTRLEQIESHATRALFYRERNSHEGISRLRSLRKLKARMVNQAFLDEISDMEDLEYLSIETVTAVHLGPLLKLRSLRVLKIEDVRKVKDFSRLAEIPTLRGLYIENARFLDSLDFLSGAHHLYRIGVEGAIYRDQKVASLSPLGGLERLQSLFLSSVELVDKDLRVLAECPELRELECARFAPRESFEQLRRLMPELRCAWCDDYERGLIERESCSR